MDFGTYAFEKMCLSSTETPVVNGDRHARTDAIPDSMYGTLRARPRVCTAICHLANMRWRVGRTARRYSNAATLGKSLGKRRTDLGKLLDFVGRQSAAPVR